MAKFFSGKVTTTLQVTAVITPWFSQIDQNVHICNWILDMVRAHVVMFV